MKRYDIINHLIKKFGYTSYLEIGCQNDRCFNAVELRPDQKVGVDPERGGTHRMTSDDFFERNIQTFDIIFIDGLHEAAQVEKDILNALEVLKLGGCILCHDMAPLSEAMQQVPRIQTEWTGDCWRAFVKLRATRKDLSMRVVDTDYGVGMIQRGVQELVEADEHITYEKFAGNKKELLNLISVEEFLAIY